MFLLRHLPLSQHNIWCLGNFCVVTLRTLRLVRKIGHHHHHHHHNHHISFMELAHLLTRSGLTYPEVSSKVYHDSFCRLGSSVSLPWVIYFGPFYSIRWVWPLSVFNVCHPEVFNTYINIQWCISQTQQNFIMFIIVLGQQNVSSLMESSSGPFNKHCWVSTCILEGPEDDSIRIETCCPNTIISIINVSEMCHLCCVCK